MLRRNWAFLIVAALAVSACEGPDGPAGPSGAAGPAGPAGANGAAGPAGQDANENCTQCHDGDVGLFAVQVQYANSIHRLGGNFERSTTSCAPCHTHQGFLERIGNGAMVTAADVPNPAPINCRTCHTIHTTFTDSDFALTSTDPVTFWNAGHGTADLGDVGNLCAQCHQGRVLSPMPVIGGADVTLTSSRYGYHHGPQGTVLAGVGAFEFSGSEDIDGGPFVHATGDACSSCHMGAAFGEQAGGHTWKMSYDYHGHEVDNVAGCTGAGCHSSMDDFNDKGDIKAQVIALIHDVEVELIRLGIHTGSGHYAVTGVQDADLAAAFVNYQMFAEDRSNGIHNPPYAISVLTNTLETLQGM